MKTTSAYSVTIYMAGDIATAKQCCREFCYASGFCVSVQPCSFIYTGGEEDGFAVTAINYARFPSEPVTLFERMANLASYLAGRCCQRSYSLVAPDKSVYVEVEGLPG